MLGGFLFVCKRLCVESSRDFRVSVFEGFIRLKGGGEAV